MAGGHPTGTVTFLFTDIVGSTRLWEHQLAQTERAVRWHDHLIEACATARGGYAFNHSGDSWAIAFSDPLIATECALELRDVDVALAEAAGGLGPVPSELAVDVPAEDLEELGATDLVEVGISLVRDRRREAVRALAEVAHARGLRVRAYLKGDASAGACWSAGAGLSPPSPWNAWQSAQPADWAILDHPFEKRGWLARLQRAGSLAVVIDDARMRGEGLVAVAVETDFGCGVSSSSFWADEVLDTYFKYKTLTVQNRLRRAIYDAAQ